MYAFEPRFPVDHVLAAIRLIRAGSPPTGSLLKLTGAAVGEIGALLENGPIFSAMDVPEVDIEEAIAKLEALEFSAEAAEPNFDITPFIPVIIAVIQWIIKRRQG
jgi:hypothetical protein